MECKTLFSLAVEIYGKVQQNNQNDDRNDIEDKIMNFQINRNEIENVNKNENEDENKSMTKIENGNKNGNKNKSKNEINSLIAVSENENISNDNSVEGNGRSMDSNTIPKLQIGR